MLRKLAKISGTSFWCKILEHVSYLLDDFLVYRTISHLLLNHKEDSALTKVHCVGGSSNNIQHF